MWKPNRIRRLRSKERVWDILKAQNPELSRAKFDEIYPSVVNMVKVLEVSTHR